jgi:hypothetical protein
MDRKQLIKVNFTDQELEAYARIVERETYGDTRGAFWAIVAVGFLASLGGGFAALGLGVAIPSGASVVAVFIMAGFFLGLWSPAMIFARARRRALRAQSSTTSLLIADNGLFVRRPGARGFFARGAIAGVAADRGLALIRVRQGRMIAVPLRLLDAEARLRLKALAPTMA